MKKALDDLVVLDFTRYIAGPFAAYLLGHMGAYVIKVEKSYIGEDFRMYPPMYQGESLAYPSYAANKHSLCMNLRNDKAKEILTRLLPHVDILIQNFRAGTIEKMGFDWDTVHKINPRLIMANNSGFGQYGPYSKRVAFDSIIQSEAGLIDTVVEEAGRPYYPGGNNSDHTGALSFVCAILAALNARDCTGEGQYLEVDMMSAVSCVQSPALSLYGASGRSMRIHDMAPYGFYPDKSGRYLQISCPDRLWNSFLEVTGIAKLASSDFSTLEARRDNKDALDTLVKEWTSAHMGEEICSALESHGIGAALVRDFKDIIENEHAKASKSFVSLDVPYVGPVPYPSVPFDLSASPIEYGKVSKIGEDNFEVLHKFLNMSEQEVSALREEGVLYQAEHAAWK